MTWSGDARDWVSGEGASDTKLDTELKDRANFLLMRVLADYDGDEAGDHTLSTTGAWTVLDDTEGNFKHTVTISGTTLSEKVRIDIRIPLQAEGAGVFTVQFRVTRDGTAIAESLGLIGMENATPNRWRVFSTYEVDDPGAGTFIYRLEYKLSAQSFKMLRATERPRFTISGW